MLTVSSVLFLFTKPTGTTDKFVAYGSLYFTIPGIYAAAPILSAWMANNSEPYFRRASSIAFGFIATNCVRDYCTLKTLIVIDTRPRVI